MAARTPEQRRAWSDRTRSSFRIYMDPPPSQIAGSLGRFADKVKDFRDVWPVVVNRVMIPGVGYNISSRGVSLGKPWPTEERDYQRRKARAGFGTVDLEYSKKLIMKLRSATTVLKMVRKSVTWGVDLPYARAVNFGYRIKAGTTQITKTGRTYVGGAHGKAVIRPRKFMAWSDTMRDVTTRVLNQYIERVMAQAAKEMTATKREVTV